MKNEIKKNKIRIAPGALKTQCGIAQMMGMGKSIRQIWVKLPENADNIQLLLNNKTSCRS